MNVRMPAVLCALSYAFGCGLLAACSGSSPTLAPVLAAPPIKHVFTIVFENQAYDNTFGTVMPVPYLSKTVAAQGALLENYYGTSHVSEGNYLSLISGQAVTVANQNDCTQLVVGGKTYGFAHTDILVAGLEAYDQIKGTGCVYPGGTLTIADQLTAKGLRWKGYMEDMGNDPQREEATCGQPSAGIGNADNTAKAQLSPIVDQYAARHNPFTYFHSLIDSGQCAKNVVPLKDTTLPNDLASIATTPNYVFITPNLCNDGHDVPCVAGGDSTYVHENDFLKKWVPIIVHSPAFQADGLLMITFDESGPSPFAGDGAYTQLYDGTACCNEPSGANVQLPGSPELAAEQGITYSGGPGNSGGGRTGSILVSPFIKPGTVSTVDYNHYATLRSMEDIFGLSHIGYAAYPGTRPFGSDIFGSPIQRYSPAL